MVCYKLLHFCLEVQNMMGYNTLMFTGRWPKVGARIVQSSRRTCSLHCLHWWDWCCRHKEVSAWLYSHPDVHQLVYCRAELAGFYLGSFWAQRNILLTDVEGKPVWVSSPLGKDMKHVRPYVCAFGHVCKISWGSYKSKNSLRSCSDCLCKLIILHCITVTVGKQSIFYLLVGLAG